MAFGLPVEGDEGPFAGDALAEVATCGPDESVEAALSRLGGADDDRAVVVNDHGVVLGLVERRGLERSAPGEPVSKVMSLSPSTVRPSVVLSSLAEAEAPILVTDSAGVLLGVVQPSSEPEPGARSEMEQLQTTFLDVAHALEERFGDEDPSEDEVRAFLHERLVAEGQTSEEADAYLSAMNESSQE